ncbi:class I SAM-dependent methyltransferase [Thalassolituus oleivorans]|jgi:predicted nicotinamide N-methyase|uniref:Protein methyltransferase n=1 Tax=hydrothermal vent metagenome TaxID=652676 RepID=A0A160TBD2_9ZZZZ|nr:50S ribosomal protein L11 methyltransferase [Thalassolituus oleivorans]MBQ0728577.1 methyltransferase [Thalassolituus oleivorans]MBQ0781084.1 methyltransferase [Thalassolituus oleivorans]
MTISNPILDTRIRTMLADAYVSQQVLPQCSEIKLWLVEPETMRRPFSQDEIRNIQEYPAYWAFCWASGQVLAREILANPSWVKGKKVMDFGAGSGVVAVAAVMAGAAEVIACDIDPDALLSCQHNAELNGTQFRLHHDLFEFDEPLDLLIAADVLYDRANLPLLEIFRQKAQEVLVADSRVKDFDFPPYQAIGRHESFTVPDLDELDEFRWVNLYHCK